MSNVAFIWEKSVYTRTANGAWQRKDIARPDDAVAVIAAAYGGNGRKRGTLRLCYDPDVLLTELLECSHGGRETVRDALREQHQALANDTVGWGIQPQFTVAGATVPLTFLSSETNPHLFGLVEALAERKLYVNGAFPLVTIGMIAPPAPGRSTILMVIDRTEQAFVYITTATGQRQARKMYVGENASADMWADVRAFLAENGFTPDASSSKATIRIYSTPETNLEQSCPFWNDLSAHHAVDELSFDALSKLVSGVSSRHQSDLTSGFPRKVDLTPVVRWVTAAFVAVLVGIYASVLLAQQGEVQATSKLTSAKAKAERVRNGLSKNKSDMEALAQLYGDDTIWPGRGRAEFLQAISATMPINYTVTLASLAEDGSFRIDGIVWNAGETATKDSILTPVQTALEKTMRSISVDTSKGQYDTTKGTFTIAGSIRKLIVPKATEGGSQ